MSKHNSKGFTLIELLVALFIFTIISFIIANVLRHVFDIQAVTDKHSVLLSQFQGATLRLERDLQQTIDRNIINAKGVTEPPFAGILQSMDFTHGGLVNPDSTLTRSTLQRTTYFVQNKVLIRRSWNVLDQHANSEPLDLPLLSGVKDFSIVYLDANKQWQMQWPKDKTNRNAIPLAVKIKFELENFGHFEQIYLTMGKPLELTG